ncbi:Putative acyltransferase 3 domain-containing protein [Septoria linicola]|uniref:Acyltransferase 3 domain-containing protein n=1 Tax=Septoria linicola TaxID=215465 RepID=A0A9Q9AU23_9PEZI|nr:putative acyltransferase 3 domain-containing protein [Septoria linicola]USW55145.1 Putative acyltransferase 3 domain-containing protein [Septoria linicola]
MATPRGSTAYLDGLRGLAAVVVFIQHYAGDFTNNEHDHGFGQTGHYYFVSLPFIRFFWNGGNAAVVLFFILSGYVLSIGHLKKLRDGRTVGRSLLSAVVRRPVRLYGPPLVVTLVYALLLHVPGPLVLPLPWMQPQEGGLLAEILYFAKTSIYYFNPFREHSSHEYWYPYNVVMWTIPIELKGSMLVFAVADVASRLSLDTSYRSVLVAASTIFFTSAAMLLLCFKWSMSAFLFGIFLAFIDVWELDENILARFSAQTRTKTLYALFFTGWYLITQPARGGDMKFSSETPGWMILTSLLPPGYDDDNYYRFWQVWGSLLSVYALLRLQTLQRLFTTKTLLFFGEVSFMVYLLHLPMFRILGDRLSALLGGSVSVELQGTFWERSWAVLNIGPLGLSLRFLICVAIELPLTLLASKYATEYLDKPMTRLSKRLAAKLGLETQSLLQNPDFGDSVALPMIERNWTFSS